MKDHRPLYRLVSIQFSLLFGALSNSAIGQLYITQWDMSATELEFNIAGSFDYPGFTPPFDANSIWVGEPGATILGISHRTVGKHLENVFLKLGLENRANLMILNREPN